MSKSIDIQCPKCNRIIIAKMRYVNSAATKFKKICPYCNNGFEYTIYAKLSIVVNNEGVKNER